MDTVVINDTRKTLLVSDLEVAETGWQRLRGLIGRTRQDFYRGKGLWLPFCEGVHTIGMAFPIDAAYLDSDYRVLLAFRKLKPYRFCRIKWNAKSILELPEGALAESGTVVGDQLQFLAT